MCIRDRPSAVLMEASTGKVLFEKNSHEVRACASITKVMTLLLVMEAIDQGRMSLTDTITASEHASSMGGSDIWLEPGETMSADDMVKATVVASANDAAVALAEHLEGCLLYTSIGFFEAMGQAPRDEIAFPDVEEFPASELLSMEKEITGMYLSGHPMAAYAQAAAKLNAAKIGEIAEAHGEYDRYHDGTNVTLLCIINSVRLKTTKNNSTMAFVQIEDLYGGIEMLVFSKAVSYTHLLDAGRPVGFTSPVFISLIVSSL